MEPLTGIEPVTSSLPRTRKLYICGQQLNSDIENKGVIMETSEISEHEKARTEGENLVDVSSIKRGIRDLVSGLDVQLAECRRDLETSKRAWQILHDSAQTDMAKAKKRIAELEAGMGLQIALREQAANAALQWKAERDQLAASLETARKLGAKLVDFLSEGLEAAWEGADWEGYEIQEKAEELGLIKCEPYDPEKHNQYGSFEGEIGDDFYTIRDEVLRLQEAQIDKPSAAQHNHDTLDEALGCEQCQNDGTLNLGSGPTLRTRGNRNE